MSQEQGQVVKRYTLPIRPSHEPHDFVMGRVVHASIAGHHCQQSDISNIWLWTIEPPAPRPRKLVVTRDDEPTAPPNQARYITTVIAPFWSVTPLDEPTRSMISESLVFHVFELIKPIPSEHNPYEVAGARDVISDIIGDELEQSMQDMHWSRRPHAAP